MASGYLEPALFNKESNELAAEAETLRQEKDGLMRSVNGDMVMIEELQRPAPVYIQRNHDDGIR